MCRIQSIWGSQVSLFLFYPYACRWPYSLGGRNQLALKGSWDTESSAIHTMHRKQKRQLNKPDLSLPPCPASRKSLKHLCLAASVPQRSSDERTGRTQNMNAGWNSSPPYLDTPYLLLKLSSQLWFNFAGWLRKSLVYHPSRVLHLQWPFLRATLDSALGIFNLFTMIHISPLPNQSRCPWSSPNPLSSPDSTLHI